MKIKYGILLGIMFLFFSCNRDVERDSLELETKSKFNAEAIWEYNGDSEIVKTVISNLKQSSKSEELSRKIWKRDVLWEKSNFLEIKGKKKILVPILNNEKTKVSGILLFNKNKENITYHLTMRKDLYNEESHLPLWKKEGWLGYFMALDKEILEIENDSPGLSKRKLGKSEKKDLASRWEEDCTIYEEEYCFYYIFMAGGEVYDIVEEEECSYTYYPDCTSYWVDDYYEENYYNDDYYDDYNGGSSSSVSKQYLIKCVNIKNIEGCNPRYFF